MTNEEKLYQVFPDGISPFSKVWLSEEYQEPQTFKWCTDCKEYDQEKHCCHRWSKVIKDTVEEMKQEQEPRWIPVSERLPDKNVWVLVTVEQSGNRYQEIMRRTNYIESWTDNIDNYTDEITAWMPLPEPYEPQESEEV